MRGKAGSLAEQTGEGEHEMGIGPPVWKSNLQTQKIGTCPHHPDKMKTRNSLSSSSTDSTMELKKSMGLLSGTALIVGTMIGSGIFVSPRGVLEGTGSVGMSLVIWILCGLLALCGALTYAELGTAIQESGGEHAYLKKAFFPMGKCFGRLPVFLFDWLTVFILRPSMFAIMALSLGTYATQPFYGQCQAPMHIIKIVTIMAMALAGFINATSVRAALFVQNTLTASKLLAAFVIIIGGIVHLCRGDSSVVEEGFEGTKSDLSLLAVSFYNGLWAYDGWNNLNFATAELQNPAINLPRSIVIGIPLTTAIYVLINIGYFSVMSKEEILQVDAVAVIWGEKVLGVFSFIIPVFVILSCFGAVNGTIFSSGRLTYVAAKDNHLPSVLSYIHVHKKTPLSSVVFTTAIGILLILTGDLASLIEFFSFTAWMFYGFCAFAAILLRRREKELPRPYKVPLLIPVIVVVASMYLLIAPIINKPQMEYLYPLLFTALGIIIYVPFVYFGYSPKYMRMVTVYLQKLFLIGPTSSEDSYDYQVP